MNIIDQEFKAKIQHILRDYVGKPLSKVFLSWSPGYTWRISIVGALLLTYVGYIFVCTGETVIVNREHYQKRIKKLTRTDIPIEPLRGMIYSETGEMIAASLPEYDLYLDYRHKDDLYTTTVYDSVLHKKVRKEVCLIPSDTIDYYFADDGPAARYLHKLAPHRSTAELARRARWAYETGTKDRRVLMVRSVPYLEYKRMRKEAPYFSKSTNRSGLVPEERPHRQRPFGESRMAAATIGGVFAADTFRIENGEKENYKGRGRNGLELTFDSLLAGQKGKGFKQYIRGQYRVVVEEEPVDGADVYTTLDMEMQTILDYELNKRILELRATGGWAAVMETSSGKIKAISNLKRTGETCVEDYNHFIMDLYDPGSTFKTVSYMVLLDDGRVTPSTIVDTGNTPEHGSSWNYHGKEIRDDHPVGIVTADEAMVQSSNIALAKLTTGAYDSDPQRYLDLIDKTHIFDDMGLGVEFQGAQAPRRRKVGDKTWSKVSLGQISYGYESRIPGMYMLNFYNAIANGGKLMRPYIVSKVMKDGQVIYSREPQVINSKICSGGTLNALRHALEGVVDHGTAETKWNSNGIYREGAKSKKVKIAGKTGTAQRYDEVRKTYAGTGHYVSFAGYFPADDPRYTCVVVIDARPGGNYGRPGGGYMAGPVFRNFAEQVYARSCFRSLKEVRTDSTNVATHSMYPRAKVGPEDATSNVISELGLNKVRNQMGIKNVNPTKITPGLVPDVRGMGAIDAVYMLENAGLRVTLTGRGRVVSQSMAPGTKHLRGQTIAIRLE